MYVRKRNTCVLEWSSWSYIESVYCIVYSIRTFLWRFMYIRILGRSKHTWTVGVDCWVAFWLNIHPALKAAQVQFPTRVKCVTLISLTNMYSIIKSNTREPHSIMCALILLKWHDTKLLRSFIWHVNVFNLLSFCFLELSNDFIISEVGLLIWWIFCKGLALALIWCPFHFIIQFLNQRVQFQNQHVQDCSVFGWEGGNNKRNSYHDLFINFLVWIQFYYHCHWNYYY